MLLELKEKNSDITLYSIYDKEFLEYGRIIKGLDTKAIIEAAKQIQNPENGSAYVASEESFQSLSIAEDIAYEVFGEMPTQIGYCWGHSNQLNGAEWHTSSEVNIAVTPLVLFLGKRQDVLDGRVDSSLFKAFFFPEGTVIEVYSTSLHFCPCEVQKEGFGCVVALPEGTNVPLVNESEDKYLFRKNKWLLSHIDNKGLLARGAMPGVTGINYEIKY